MNRQLYELCHEYCKCYDVMGCLLSVDELAGERLKLFRLMETRTESLEREIEEAIVESDLRKSMVENGKKEANNQS